jgi:murein L,D-transpeptidase YafK/ketosteroid isomerase-like protein
MSNCELKKHTTSRTVGYPALICLAAFFYASILPAAGQPEVPGMLIYQDPEDAPAYAVIVDKNSQELFLYETGGESRLLKRMRCSTGENRGPKKDAGDKKTPEGIYFFTDEYRDCDIAPIYGSRAFPIDYPNYIDRMNGCGGNAIWLHGTNKPLKNMDSNGCIVLNNADIDELDAFLELNRTPMLIAAKMTYRDAGQSRELGTRLLAFLNEWRHAMENGAYHDYLRFYASDFMPEMGWWNDWNRARTAMRNMGKTVNVRLTRKALYFHEAVYVAVFDQQLQAGGDVAPAGTRKLFFREQDGGYRIIGDQDRVPSSEKPEPRPSSELLAAAGRLQHLRDDGDDIRRMIDGWMDAWASGDIKQYGDYYAGDFFSRGMDRNAWIEYKDRLSGKYAYIRVKQENLRIGKGDRSRNVSFIQTYESDLFKTRGRKRLILKKEDGKWKIHRETWEKI